MIAQRELDDRHGSLARHVQAVATAGFGGLDDPPASLLSQLVVAI